MIKFLREFITQQINFLKQEKYIEQLLDFFTNNADYKSFLDSDERCKEINQRNDIYVWEVTFFDTYDNKEMNCLVKAISKLDQGEYDVSLNYRVKKFRDLNYFQLQYDQSSMSNLAQIKFKNDKFINRIEISFTQINNNQAVVQYDFRFRKLMTNEMIFSFIKDNNKCLYRKLFIGFYDLDRMINNKEFDLLYNILINLKILAFQAKLAGLVPLSIGKYHKLPSCIATSYPQDLFDKESYKDVFLCTSFEINNGEKYLIVDHTANEGATMDLCFSGKSFSSLNFLGLIGHYRMNFYYFLFGKIEDFYLNKRINK